MYSLDDTIAAIASPPGGAARGIVRISGPESLDSVAQFFHADTGEPLSSRHSPHAIAGRLQLPELGAPMPCDAYCWFDDSAWRQGPAGTNANPAPSPQVRSYTGQPLVELHTIGSPPLLQLLLQSLCSAGARLANPGEFTLRAFLAGRIDLSQAEAVLGVIDATDPHELQVALGQLAGGLSRPLQRLRDALLELLAHVEAGFDFADEDLPFITRGELDRQLAEAEKTVAAILAQTTSRSEPVDAVQAVLVGRPNVGKSSLFNALAGNHAAIVSEHPGTTRDYLVAELDLDGVKCRLIDVAGTEMDAPGQEGRAEAGPGHDLREAAQSAAAIQRRQSRVEVLCLDAARQPDNWEQVELADSAASRRIVVLTKCDAPRCNDVRQAAIETSSLSGQGIDALRAALRRAALAAAGAQGDVVAATAVRCCESLRSADDALRRARQLAAAAQEELAAAEIRLALEELGRVVGAVYTEDVLDRIFSRFCVGK
jgi:tRNA modification GTPase